MTIRVGNIELKGVQNVHTEEARTLIEQRVPEQQGSVFQDLGREPVTIVLDGELFGGDVLSALEKLRRAQAKAEPLSFAADVAVGTELTEVLVEDIRIRQIAGFTDRYRFAMRLKEHVQPPPAAGAALAPVNEGIGTDAAAWGADSLATAGVLQNPASLATALAARPDLLDKLDMNDLGDAVARNASFINAGDLNGIVEAVGNADPSKASQFFDRLKNAGALGGMLAQYVQEGIAFATRLDPGKLSALMKAFSGGLEFLQKLKQVADDGGRLVRDLGELKLPDDLAGLFKGGLSEGGAP
jgi:hypothetical protein